MFSYFMPTKLIVGRNAVKNNPDALILGKKAVIVTGRNSAKKCGALDDVIKVLNENNIRYCIFDKILNNPSVENVFEGGEFAKENGVDFVIGIGGGSPLDASKAIATYAVNSLSAYEIFNPTFETSPLPIIAIPTTAGTGSETTPYSVLTVGSEQNKKTYSNPACFPKTAFLDTRYMEALSRDVCINTTLDAMAHSIEGYLNRKSSSISDGLAIFALELIASGIENLKSYTLTEENLEAFMQASTIGGMVISQTGTTIPHSMSYPITFFKDVPHGKAIALILAEFLSFNYDASPDIREKIDNILSIFSCTDIAGFNTLIKSLVKADFDIDESDINTWVDIAINAKNALVNPKQPLTRDDELSIYRKSFL